MSTTLTVRTPDELRDALAQKARSQGKSVSELVREILENAVVERSLFERTRHLIGQLEFEVDNDEWRRQIQERNWRR